MSGFSLFLSLFLMLFRGLRLFTDSKGCQKCCYWAGKLRCLVLSASPGLGQPLQHCKGRIRGLRSCSSQPLCSPCHSLAAERWMQTAQISSGEYNRGSASVWIVGLMPEYLEIHGFTPCPQVSSLGEGGSYSLWSCQNWRRITSMA